MSSGRKGEREGGRERVRKGAKQGHWSRGCVGEEDWAEGRSAQSSSQSSLQPVLPVLGRTGLKGDRMDRAWICRIGGTDRCRPERERVREREGKRKEGSNNGEKEEGRKARMSSRQSRIRRTHAREAK
jgi:hypothetical protein